MMTFRTDLLLVLAILHSNITYGLLGFYASQVVLVVKNPPAKAGDVRDTGSIPGSGRSLEEGMETIPGLLSMENPTDRGASLAIVHRVTKSWTQLK